MNIFIQIGLKQSLEYAYLASAADKNVGAYLQMMYNALSRHGFDEFVLPSEYSHYIGTSMRVIGVDMNPRSIEGLKKFYADNPNISFINAAIYDKDVDEIEHNSWDITGRTWQEDAQPARTRCLTLASLFEEVLSAHPDSQIFGLSLDVEGAEFDILKAYDWSIRPNYVVVEFHYTDHIRHDEAIISMFIDQGYKVHTKFNNFAKFVL